MRRRERESLWRAKNGMTEKWRQEIEGETEKFKKQNKKTRNVSVESQSAATLNRQLRLSTTGQQIMIVGNVCVRVCARVCVLGGNYV